MRLGWPWIVSMFVHIRRVLFKDTFGNILFFYFDMAFAPAFTAAGSKTLREYELGLLLIGERLIAIYLLHVITIYGESGSCALTESHTVEMDIALFTAYPYTRDKVGSEAHEP